MTRVLTPVLIAALVAAVPAAASVLSVGASAMPPVPPDEVTPVAEPAAAAVAEPAAAAVAEQVLYRKDTHGYDCFRIPAIVRTTQGTLLAFAEARKDVGEKWCDDQGDIDLVVRRSVDGGETWGPIITVSGADGETHGNPVPIVVQDGPHEGRIVLLTTHNPAGSSLPRTPYVQYSTAEQDGTEWSEPVSLADAIDRPDWGWYATGPVHGIQLTRGEHPGRLIAGINAGPENGDPIAGIVYSDDGGDTWKLGGTQPGADDETVPQEISPVELVDGRIHLAARNQNKEGDWGRAYATSSDGGASLDGPFTQISGLQATKAVQGSTLRLRATDEGDRYNRILLATPVDPVENLRRDLTIYSSYDEGTTWGHGARITTDRSGYSDMVEIDDGRIGLLYEAGEWSGDARDEIRFARLTEADLGLPDGPAGTTTPDTSGNGLDASLRGNARIGGGQVGSSVLLDCGDDHVRLPYAESLAVESGDFTLTLWFRYGQSAADQALFWAYGQGSSTPQVWVRAEPGGARIRAWLTTPAGSASVSSSEAYDDDAWHHLALRRDGDELAMWIDGEQVGTATTPEGSVSTLRPFSIVLGRRLDGAHCFDGRFDEFRLYRRALSPDELEEIRTDNAVVPDTAIRLPFDTATS